MRLARRVLTLIGGLCIVYLCVTAYLGFRVGTAINDAEKREPVRTGARILGRVAIERYAIARSGIPPYLIESPTFWLLLHQTE